MSEIDLIPNAYKEHVWKLHALKVFVFIIMSVLVLTGLAYGALSYAKNMTTMEVLNLSNKKEIASQQRENIRLLDQEKSELGYQLRLLNGLRSAVDAEDLFVVIDTAIEDIDIWFTNIKFQRAEIEVDHENVVNTGYFLIVTTSNENKALAISTKMLITGEAANHSTLSKFVNNLLDQVEILDAKVLETSSDRDHKGDVVRFNLSITLNLDEKLS
jgi:hypothetical protein